MHQPTNWGVQFNWPEGQQPPLAGLRELSGGAVVRTEAEHLTMNPAARGLPEPAFQDALRPLLPISEFTNLYLNLPLPARAGSSPESMVVSEITTPMEYANNFVGLDRAVLKSLYTLTVFEYYNDLYRLFVETARGTSLALSLEFALEDKEELGLSHHNCFFSCILEHP